MDLKILVYPVHLHRFPANASRISSSDGCGFRLIRAVADMITPGVQYPHWKPMFFTNDCWTAESFPPSARPSIVVISRPSVTRRHHARIDRLTVHHNRAGATSTKITSSLRPLQPKIFPNHVRQQGIRPHLQLMNPTIYSQRNHFLHQFATTVAPSIARLTHSLTRTRATSRLYSASP